MNGYYQPRIRTFYLCVEMRLKVIEIIRDLGGLSMMLHNEKHLV